MKLFSILIDSRASAQESLDRLRTYLRDGKKLNTPSVIYNKKIVHTCSNNYYIEYLCKYWQMNENERPSFKEIAKSIAEKITPKPGDYFIYRTGET